MYYFLALLPICQILETFVSIEIFNVFLTPLRIWFLSGLTISIKYLHPKSLLQFIENSKVHLAFFTFCILNIFSIFHSEKSLSTAIFYFGIWLSVITISIRYNTNKSETSFNVKKVINTLKFAFWVDISAASLQIIFRDHIFYRLGIFGTISESLVKVRVGDTTPYSQFVTGLHIERLFLCEFLLIGLVIFIFRDNNIALKILLVLWVGLIIITTGSLTGLVGFFLLITIYVLQSLSNLMRWCFISLIPLLLIISTIQIDSRNSKVLLEKIYGDKKAASITTESRSSNWRFVSSLHLIEQLSFNHHLILGNGFRSHEQLMPDIWVAYNQAKQRKNYVESKAMSVHSMLSVLYDQGLIAFISLVALLFLWISFTPSINFSSKDILYNKLFQCFLLITSLRFLFYYHSSPRFSLILCMIFFIYLKHIDSQEASN